MAMRAHNRSGGGFVSGIRVDASAEQLCSADREAEQAGDPPGDAESVARLVCLRLLDSRARTRAELATALRRRGVPQSAADTVLGRFVELGLIDDVALANEFVLARHRARGQTGPALAAALRSRGVADHVVTDALAQIDADADAAAARSLARTRLARMGAVDSVTATRRLMGLLGRRGHSAALAAQAVKDVLAERDGLISDFDPWSLDLTATRS
jgi:regulatory protein